MERELEEERSHDVYSEEEIHFEDFRVDRQPMKPKPKPEVSSNMSRVANAYLGTIYKPEQKRGAAEPREKILTHKERYKNRQSCRIKVDGSDGSLTGGELESRNVDVRPSVLIQVQHRLEEQLGWQDMKVKFGSIKPVEVVKKQAKVSKQLSAEERKGRLSNLERAKQILSGKVSVVWIYAIKEEIEESLRDRIYECYQGLLDDSNIVPFVKDAWEIQPFLSIPNSYFKIVCCLENVEVALRYKINVKVVQYHLYDPTNNLARALQFKNLTRKVKSVSTDLEKIVQRTEEQIEDSITIYRANNVLEKSQKTKRFPSFLQLSGKDKTEATLYRANLYGALRVAACELPQHLLNFLDLVDEKYGGSVKQKGNIGDYCRLQHDKLVDTLDRSAEVIKFYVRESFYYQVLNSMLRTLKTTEEFKPCILPFQETYSSIKNYYHKNLEDSKQRIESLTVYRGCTLKKKDFQALKKGVFIEMYGFMSTSKSFKKAESFTDHDGYIMKIQIKERTVKHKYILYDHGFVDLNRYGLSSFAGEEEVLFNALNLFKVGDIQEVEGYRVINLEYGSIFQLLEKQSTGKTLSCDEQDVLLNYQYCIKMFKDIEDQGDVFLIASEFDEAKGYYKDRIQQDSSKAGNYLKLANVQKECGEIDEAQKNGKISLQMLQESLDLNDRETCLKVFSIHSKNAEINLCKEDYLNADKELTEGIELLDDSQLFEKAKKIRERGDIKFKKGEINDAQKDFDASEYMFQELSKQGEQRKWQLKKKYAFNLLTLCCRATTKHELDDKYQEELSEIKNQEENIHQIREDIESELITVNKSLQEVAIYVDDRQKYEYCVKKARGHLIHLQQRETKDPIAKAKLKVMQATVEDYLELAESEKLLYDAIALIESQAPFDMVVADYSTILAKIQKKSLEKLTINRDRVTPYDRVEQEAIYNRCKDNFNKAINVLLYNNKTKDAPEVLALKNQIGSLEFGQANFGSCEEIIAEVKKAGLHTEHTQISKASLLLSKIALARGELKNAFTTLQEAQDSLRRALVKSETAQYVRIYERSDCYLEVSFTRAKVYSKQLSHDLALQTLMNLDQRIKDKMEGYQSHALSELMLEEIAQIKANKGEVDFADYFEKAISQRVRQMGKYNILNAVSHCNCAKYYMMFNDLEKAEAQLSQAVEIFSCLSSDHPINWIIYFSNGIFSEKKEQFKQADGLLRSSLKMVEVKFDFSHITIKKVRLKVAKNLLRMGQTEQSMKQLEELDQDLDEGLRESCLRAEVRQEMDDEKITLKKIIYNELMQENVGNRKYEQKYDDLRRTFRLDSDETK